MNIIKRLKTYLCLILVTIVLTGSLTETYAASIRITTRITFTVRTKKTVAKPYLDYKKVTLYQGDHFTLTLKNAKKNVKWSASKKSVKLKKKGNKVIVTYKKPGNCKIKANYRGKTYTCKVSCCNGLDPDSIAIFNNSPMFLECHYIAGNITACAMVMNYRQAGGVSARVLNPSVAVCKWDTEGWHHNDSDGSYYTFLWVGGLRPGTTTVEITNLYNPAEKEYISVTVTGDPPIIERRPSYDPFNPFR